MKSKKVVIALCPGNFITGGPELIHQFVGCINQCGGNAKILYFPFNRDFDVPKPYIKYKVTSCKLNDLKNDNYFFVIPEVATSYIKFLPGKNFHIWWLSVDNYFKCKNISLFFKVELFFTKLIQYLNLPFRINRLTKFNHWVQSYYAKDFLQFYGIESKSLSDFLNVQHLGDNIDIEGKKNIICFNPKKGKRTTNKLINAFPNYKFVAIQNMSTDEVSELLRSAKIYIDFGNHPGKDRIPREAAMAKCIVITGTKGSANNKYDIMIESKYKIDECNKNYVTVTGNLIQDIFDRFEYHVDIFDKYRHNITCERALFKQQVLDFIENINNTENN